MRLKRDFVFDPSLVLYLPLYKLDGDSFMSKDAYGHLCTVTGALWKPDGRSFDGGDDYITVPQHVSIPSGATARTIQAWVYLDNHSDWNSIIRWGEADSEKLCSFATKVTSGYLGLYFYGDDHDSGVAVGTGAWHLVSATFIGTTSKLYLDDSLISTKSDHGAVNTTATDVWIGTNEIQDNNWFDGVVGEIMLYNRALTLLEIQHNYLATKWRYK